jgi:hypothetical protein
LPTLVTCQLWPLANFGHLPTLATRQRWSLANLGHLPTWVTCQLGSLANLDRLPTLATCQLWPLANFGHLPTLATCQLWSRGQLAKARGLARGEGERCLYVRTGRAAQTGFTGLRQYNIFPHALMGMLRRQYIPSVTPRTTITTLVTCQLWSLANFGHLPTLST